MSACLTCEGHGWIPEGDSGLKLKKCPDCESATQPTSEPAKPPCYNCGLPFDTHTFHDAEHHCSIVASVYQPTSEPAPKRETATPRTDAEWKGYPALSNDHFGYKVVRVAFAMELERELTQAEQTIAGLREELALHELGIKHRIDALKAQLAEALAKIGELTAQVNGSDEKEEAC